MKTTIERKETIAVCSGAGCRAWSSETISKKLNNLSGLYSEMGYEIVEVPCLKKCGGGATVQMSGCSREVKIRKPEEALQLLFSQQVEMAIA